MNWKAAAPLFQGWNKPMIFAALQGCMGRVVTRGGEPPRSARLEVGDFAFFAGEPDRELAREAAAPILVPQNEAWAELLGRVWGDHRISPWTRYAMGQEPDGFDRDRLARYAAALPDDCRLVPLDGELYRQAMAGDWSRDLCALFDGEADYLRRGLGMAVLLEGRLAAGASSYAVCRDGIEIEIDTRPDCRRQGLALACGAGLILKCLSRGIFPGWDAHDLRSAALAQKLGYRMEGPYPVFLRIG